MRKKSLIKESSFLQRLVHTFILREINLRDVSAFVPTVKKNGAIVYIRKKEKLTHTQKKQKKHVRLSHITLIIFQS